MIKAELSDIFQHLPERSRFNRRRRNLCYISDKLRQVLTQCLPDDDVYIVDSLPVPICDFKRAYASISPLKCANGTGTSAAYGKCATKALGTFLGFRCSVITTSYGLPVDFTITPANIDDREVLPLFCERGLYPIFIGDKGYISDELEAHLLKTYTNSNKYCHIKDFYCLLAGVTLFGRSALTVTTGRALLPDFRC